MGSPEAVHTLVAARSQMAGNPGADIRVARTLVAGMPAARIPEVAGSRVRRRRVEWKCRRWKRNGRIVRRLRRGLKLVLVVVHCFVGLRAFLAARAGAMRFTPALSTTILVTRLASR